MLSFFVPIENTKIQTLTSTFSKEGIPHWINSHKLPSSKRSYYTFLHFKRLIYIEVALHKGHILFPLNLLSSYISHSLYDLERTPREHGWF